MRQNAATPRRILDTGWDYARSRTLATGLELDLFTHIASGRRTVAQVAGATKCSARGMGMLLNALVGLKFLRKDKIGEYRLTADAEEFLVRGKPGYLGDMISHTAQLAETWQGLTEAVKRGKPQMCVEEKSKAEGFFPELVKGLFAVNRPAAQYAALYLKNKKNEISNILDVACGSGVWSIAFAQVFTKARVTMLDFPPVLNIAREYSKRFGLAGRCDYIEGDLRTIDFGLGRYDLIILGHICHSEGETNTKRLLKKSYSALKEGGKILIAEFLPNNKRTGPDIPLLFALNMLLNTSEGDVFTPGQFQTWLSAEGFARVDLLRRAPAHSPLILAIK